VLLFSDDPYENIDGLSHSVGQRTSFGYRDAGPQEVLLTLVLRSDFLTLELECFLVMIRPKMLIAYHILWG
jgi:hypothetical protein